jgi:hypothetical protein
MDEDNNENNNENNNVGRACNVARDLMTGDAALRSEGRMGGQGGVMDGGGVDVDMDGTMWRCRSDRIEKGGLRGKNNKKGRKIRFVRLRHSATAASGWQT